MVMAVGTPANVRVGPGKLFIAPLGTAEPTDLASDWDEDFVPVGYTEQGSEFQFGASYEDVNVAEEMEPILVLQTARNINVVFASAEVTAQNLKFAFNGGTITTPSTNVTFEPPAAGDYTPVMLGWESDDGLERWIFRKCIQTGASNIPRRKAPAKAQIPMSFRVLKPDSGASFKFIADENYNPVTS